MSASIPLPDSVYPDAPPGFSVASGQPPSEEPPSYQERSDDPDELLQPINLVLHGRFVYAAPNESSPLYELSRVIHAQGEATTNIEFQRLEYRVRTRPDGTPSVSQRGKHIYNISHVPILFADECQSTLHAVSRKGLGNHLVLKKSPFPHSGHRAAIASEEEGGKGKKRPRNDYFFWVKEKKGKNEPESYQWFNLDGKLVATHASAGIDEGQPEYVLMILEPLTRRILDGLVAFWCLWLWHEHATNTKVKKETWKDSETAP